MRMTRECLYIGGRRFCTGRPAQQDVEHGQFRPAGRPGIRSKAGQFLEEQVFACSDLRSPECLRFHDSLNNRVAGGGALAHAWSSPARRTQ